MTGGHFGLVNECIFGDVESSGGKSCPVGIDIGICENFLRLVGESLSMQALSAVLWYESSISRDVCSFGLNGFLDGRIFTGL